jgi:glutathione synthase/RimK-type ligase-like ATP-grasp enzyme
LRETESLDVETIAEHLRRHGHVAEIINHAALIRLEPDLVRDAVVIYASAQYPEYYQYIEHCLLYAEVCGGRLLPNYLCFRAHENKFVQELIKKKLGLRAPVSRLFGTMDEIVGALDTVEFPAVLKYPQGFGGSSVSRVDSAEQLMTELRTKMIDTVIRPVGLRRAITERRRYHQRTRLYTNRYPLRTKRFILQQFLPGLDSDWKVLVFGNRLFCLKRYVRRGDFRASGSGNFTFDETPPPALLDFASAVLKAIDSPWASLDIVEADGKHYLLEFQCVHFGLYTLMRNTCYYYFDGRTWQKQAVANAEAEPYFGEAAVEYLAARYPSG